MIYVLGTLYILYCNNNIVIFIFVDIINIPNVIIYHAIMKELHTIIITLKRKINEKFANWVKILKISVHNRFILC